MIIETKGANYYPLGLGFVDWVKGFIYESGITDEAKKQAIRDLNAEIEAALLWPKIYGISFFPGSTANTQKLIFKEGIKEFMEFFGGGSVIGGFQAAEGVVAKFPFSYPSDAPANFSMGVFNKTAETNPIVDTHRILMGLNNSPYQKILLSRRYSTGTDYTTFGQIGSSVSGGYVYPAAGTYDNLKTGMLQIIKDGTTGTLLDGQTIVKTSTVSEDLSEGGPNPITIGASNFSGSGSNAVSQYSEALITFAYWGKLSVEEAKTFSTIVNNFLVAFGR